MDVSDIVDACMAQIRGRGKRLVFPEGNDARIVAAARRLQDTAIAVPVLPGLAVRAVILVFCWRENRFACVSPPPVTKKARSTRQISSR